MSSAYPPHGTDVEHWEPPRQRPMCGLDERKTRSKFSLADRYSDMLFQVQGDEPACLVLEGSDPPFGLGEFLRSLIRLRVLTLELFAH